jgi:hypothetical protein
MKVVKFYDNYGTPANALLTRFRNDYGFSAPMSSPIWKEISNYLSQHGYPTFKCTKCNAATVIRNLQKLAIAERS